MPRARALAVAQPALGLGATVLGAALVRGAALGAALGALGTGAAGLCLGCRLGRRLGLCGKSHPLGTEGGVRFIRRSGQVVDHFFSLRQVSFFCSSAGAARAAWACFYYPGALAPVALASSVFFNRKYFLKDLRGIRRDPKTA